MSAEPTTRLIERERLTELLETSRAGTRFAHTVRRPRRPRRERDSGSALRGLAFVVVATLVLRALIGWVFF
ncbi:MAG: hypothetical protein ACM31C_29840 [Acidobacteriota bacterium]